MFSQVQERGAQTKDLSNAKQIGLACKLYATDNDGKYPEKDGQQPPPQPLLTGAESSNQAFALLVPDYLPSEKLFYVGKSAWSTTVADENTTAPADRVETVTNNYAYVFGLGDTSNPSFPLIADAPEDGLHTYTTDQSVKGGLWKGKRAVVVRCDQSGSIEKCITTVAPQSEVQGQVGTGVVADIFTTAQPATWLGATNVMMYPN